MARFALTPWSAPHARLNSHHTIATAPDRAHVKHVVVLAVLTPAKHFTGQTRPTVLGAPSHMHEECPEGIARRHRGRRVPDPIVATAVIPKENMNPRWLRDLAFGEFLAFLAKDWENLNRSGLAFLKLASIHLMLRKFCNP